MSFWSPAPGVWEDIYLSAGTLGNVEHIWLPELTGTDNYRLEVLGTDIVEPAFGESYALVVAYTTVPEPGVLGVLVVGVFAVSRCGEQRKDGGVTG